MQNNSTKENTNYMPAGFWVRSFAYLIDNLILFGIMILVKLIVSLASLLMGGILDFNILFTFTIKDIVYYICGIIYFIWFTYEKGATPGKKAMHIKVISADKFENSEERFNTSHVPNNFNAAEKLNSVNNCEEKSAKENINGLTLLNVIYRESIGRYLSKILLFAGYIAVGIDSKKRGFHDMLCDTRVVYDNNFQKINKGNDMIRTINTDIITKNIKEMCIEANHFLSKDMKNALEDARLNEKSEIGCKILNQLQENMDIAAKEMIPICQDTGMTVVFAEIGQDIHFEGNPFEYAINEGIRQGYVEGFLRKSVVSDPIIRKNTNDNTPGVIHTRIVPGNQLKLTVAPKGFGSENMSKVFMLKPAEGIEGVKEAVLTAVKEAGPNACPPMVVGVGIGGTFEKCAIMAKQALTRDAGVHSNIDYVKDLEIELLEKINCLGIGPAGLGGTTTALAVNINTYPTHIAGLPVAVNICCHVNRHVTRIL